MSIKPNMSKVITHENKFLKKRIKERKMRKKDF